VTTQTEWKIIEPNVAAALTQCEFPLDELAAGTIPAIVLRNAYAATSCQKLVERLVDEELLYDPHRPIPAKFVASSIPEGYYREGINSVPKSAWQVKKETGHTRIDIGSSLGYRGSDKEAFFAHSAESHALFEQLFGNGTADGTSDGNANPIGILYDCLEQLSRNKKVVTAHEPDGRRYCPAIIRAHYGGYTYKPHFDSVRLREKRADYAVYKFQHQFAGVLVLQNTQLHDRTAQCKLHRCLWQPALDPHLTADTFHEYARENGVENVEVQLEPGDLYFFNTRSIHEVPGVAGELPRIVLATFIGYSADSPEIFVWS
jgi:hypothetical protein